MTDDPSAGATDLTRWAEQMQRKTERFQTLQARMTSLSVTTASDDRSISVVIDANGVPTDIRFTDGIRRKSPAALSAELMQCLHRARQTLTADITATVREVVGDDPIGANIIKQYEDRIGAPDTDASAAPRSPHPAPAADPVWSQQPATPRPSAPPQPPTWAQPPAPPQAATPPQPATPPRSSAPPEPLPAPSSLVPDVDDEEGEYYRRASWLV